MKISLFITCLGEAMFADLGINMAKILTRLGHTVDYPEEQMCCGQISFNSGYMEDTRTVARHLIDAFEKSEVVVAPSGSCIGMIHHNYPELFKDDPIYAKKAQDLIDKSYEFTQFMVNVLKVPDLGASYNGKVTYHPSCHATRLLGIKEEPLTLLENIRGLEIVPLPEEHLCCGFGGTFSIKMPRISEAMVAEKAQTVWDSGADILTGVDMGCLMNISGYMEKQGRPVPTRHVIPLLGKGM